MQQHRFRDLVEIQQPAGVAPGTGSAAFVPFPLGSLMPHHQQAQVVEIYRVAAERTREQLAQPRPSRRPQFSVNCCVPFRGRRLKGSPSRIWWAEVVWPCAFEKTEKNLRPLTHPISEVAPALAAYTSSS